MWNEMLLLPFGVVAGLLTTLAGMGGGILLVAALGSWLGPRDALAISTPALLVSNAHRAYALRADVARPTLALFAIGAVPGAIFGAVTAAVVPESLLSALLLVVTLLALARFAGVLRAKLSAKVVAPAAFGIGTFAGTAGGAGALVAPLYLSLGMSGSAFVATMSASAVVLHAARMLGYGAAGMFALELVPSIVALFTGLVVGNVWGLRIRPRLTERSSKRIEAFALVVATGLALFQMAA